MRLSIISAVLLSICLPLFAADPNNPNMTEKQFEQAIFDALSNHPELFKTEGGTEPRPITVNQLDEYQQKIIDRAETYYSNRFNILLWVMGISVVIVGIILPIILIQIQRHDIETKFEKIASKIKIMEKEHQAKFEKNNSDIKEAFEKVGEIAGELKGKQKVIANEFYENISMIYSALATSFSENGNYPSAILANLLSIKFNVKSHIRFNLAYNSRRFALTSELISHCVASGGMSEFIFKNATELLKVIKENISKIKEPAMQVATLQDVAKLEVLLDESKPTEGKSEDTATK